MSIAIVTSVVLSALIGVVSNALVGSWGWALVTALLVLVSCMACVQLFLHRAAGREQPTTSGESGKHESPAHVGRPADPRNPATMTFTSSTVRHSMIAGRDINQTKIGTGGILGIVGVALLLGVGTTALGRTPAAVPKRAVNQTLTPTTDNRAQNSGPGPGGV